MVNIQVFSLGHNSDGVILKEIMILDWAKAARDTRQFWGLLEDYQQTLIAGGGAQPEPFFNQVLQTMAAAQHLLLAFDMARYMCDHELSLDETSIQCLALTDDKIDQMLAQACCDDETQRQRLQDFLLE